MSDDVKDYGALIGKMKRGDKVLVTLISEPLQEQYIKVMDVYDEFKETLKKFKLLYEQPEDMPLEAARDLRVLNHKCDSMRDDFWMAINEQYKTWQIPSLGLRNGFCLVKAMDPRDIFVKLKGVMDEFMEELGNDNDE